LGGGAHWARGARGARRGPPSAIGIGGAPLAALASCESVPVWVPVEAAGAWLRYGAPRCLARKVVPGRAAQLVGCCAGSVARKTAAAGWAAIRGGREDTTRGVLIRTNASPRTRRVLLGRAPARAGRRSSSRNNHIAAKICEQTAATLSHQRA
jgi:hypothetical protein